LFHQDALIFPKISQSFIFVPSLSHIAKLRNQFSIGQKLGSKPKRLHFSHQDLDCAERAALKSSKAYFLSPQNQSLDQGFKRRFLREISWCCDEQQT
jgi:hypothetical protein